MPRLAIATPASIEAARLGGALGAEVRVRSRAQDGALIVAPISGEAILLGAYQRASSAIDLGIAARDDLRLARRATGGPAIFAAEGQVFAFIDLRDAGALGGAADVARVLNRHVRPLLAALSTLASAPATYGGRDFVQIGGHPVAFIGATHDRATGAVGIEIVVAVSTPFGLDPSLDLAHGAIAPRWLGKTPSSLRATLHRDVEPSDVVAAIVAAWSALADEDVVAFESPGLRALPPDAEAPAFTAMTEEAIGLLGARVEPGTVAIGGDLMTSRGVLDELGRAIVSLGRAPSDLLELGRAIDVALGPASGAMLIGVRSLASIEKVVRAAIEAQKGERAGE